MKKKLWNVKENWLIKKTRWFRFQQHFCSHQGHLHTNAIYLHNNSQQSHCEHLMKNTFSAVSFSSNKWVEWLLFSWVILYTSWTCKRSMYDENDCTVFFGFNVGFTILFVLIAKYIVTISYLFIYFLTQSVEHCMIKHSYWLKIGFFVLFSSVSVTIWI